jgi:Trypsin-like peptidase domain
VLAVAELAVGDDHIANGSAFAISADAALTARHCVYDGGTPLAPLHLVLPGGAEVLASLVADDAAGDVALLKLEESLPAGWEPVSLMAASACPRSTPFLVRGYPAQRPFPDPDQIDGHVVDTCATAFGGVPVVALFSPQVAAPVPRDPHGFSGAPVLVALGPSGADLAIALVRWGDVDPISADVRAGSVLAAPLEPLAARWPQVARALAPGPRPADAAPLPGSGAIRSFEAQYLGRPGRPVAFGGRARELAQIDRWVAAGDRPWLLVVAPGGTGKSALLVRWCKQAKIASVYVPISLRYELAREVVVLRALAARLAALHGDPPPGGNADALRDAVAELLTRSVPERLVVVVDGLDETEGWEAGPALLGGGLGDGVAVVVTARSTASRPNAAAWIHALGLDARNTETLSLSCLDRYGVAEVLASAGEPVQRLAQDAAAVDRLMRVTGGDPLVLAQHVNGLQRLSADDLDTAVAELPYEPAGLDEIFESWWRGQRRLWAAGGEAAGQVVWKALDVLACAHGPLRRSELAGVTSLDPNVLNDALRSLDRFVVQGPGGGFALAHMRLAEHRQQRLADDDTLEWPRRALLQWCQRALRAALQGQTQVASPYAVRHLGDHLEEAGARAEQLMELVDPRWQAAWEAVVDDFNGFGGDVTRAQSATRREAGACIAAGGPSWAAAAAVQCAIIGAGVADVTALITGELARELVRHSVWSERRAAQAVLSLPNNGAVVSGLEALAPLLSPASLAAAVDRVAAINPAGWSATHGKTMGALAARRAQLDGDVAGVTIIASMPGGTGRAIALLAFLRARPATKAGAMSLLIEELTAIAHGRNTIDVDSVLRSLAKSVSASAVAAALAGAGASPEVAIAFALPCIYRRQDRKPGSHLSPYALGILAPWLPAEQRDAALAEVVDDVAHVRWRDADGNAVAVEPSSGLLSESDYRAMFTAFELGPVARHLPPALATRAGDSAVRRFTEYQDQGLAVVIVTLAQRLPENERERALAPLLADLRGLLGRSGNIGEIQNIAAGLARCGHAADIFRAAAEDGYGGSWHNALECAADHLDAASVPEALAVASEMMELYRPWVASRVLARLASFGTDAAITALRWATTPAGGREQAAAEALRTAGHVAPVAGEPLDAEPAADADARAVSLQLLMPKPSEVQHDFDAIQGVLSRLNSLDVAGARDVAWAVERISGVSSRNELRGPVAVRLARLGALEAALDVPLDPYVSSSSLRAILRVTPEDRLDAWLTFVQRNYSGSIQADTRANLMRAAAGRIAACDPSRAWALLDAWLQRPATRLERLCDLPGYAPAVWITAGAEAARALANWIDPG